MLFRCMFFRSSLFLSVLFISVNVFAQPKQNSPYSLFGLGDFQPQYYPTQAGFGAQAIAYHDPFHLNMVNPASLSRLRSTSFEAGLFANYSNYTSQATSGSFSEWNGNLGYLALGFPLKSPINEALDRTQSPWHAGMGFSLAPYTTVGYNIETRGREPGLDSIGNLYEGTGGTYRIMWSNGIRYKNTAVGLNLSYVFGKMLYENTTTFYQDSIRLPAFQNNFRDEVKLNGIVWNLGFQHDFVLRYAVNNADIPTRWITVGVYGEGNHKLRAENDKLYLRSRGRNTNGTYAGVDTILQSNIRDARVTLPSAFGLGVQFVKSNQLRLGFQAAVENWEVYKNEVRPENLKTTFSVSAGVEYTPDYLSYNRYGRRIRYRLGGYYKQDPRVLDGKQLTDLGITLGFGFPLVLPRQQTSFVNLAIEAGRFGTGADIEEMYARISLGFTLNDNSWFYKRRFE